MNLEGRSALVAGGAGGLGSATARRLVELGVGVAVFDRDGDRADKLAAELGPRAVGVGGDVNNDADVTSAIAAARALGTFSIAVMASGDVPPSPAIVDADGNPIGIDLLDNMLAFHTRGTFNIARLAAAAFTANEPDKDGQRGVIVNTASIAAFEAQTGQVAYGAAKAAVAGMTLPLARDLGPHGIRVCAIAPGIIATPILPPGHEIYELLRKDVVFPNRLGHPEEYARLVESIVTNPYLNGENIRLDGAMRLQHKFG
ncbi:SDR family NAD(P)-dependent oxidoreductase [Yinghuangia sp. ASG 101]|uniref:SDR family NAD(P)-dependent oxidoreductase n=1 Tax=Yinghuangia sp. ASG 101 TaxID=2896848 RepID=UPI001E4EBA25|nr:SDR family NAD(P)-dependent oxidoreductase [Yinghuangia sp. ASG 101]UGQ11983.1 SDR family NAD(P)-dependent oxidoreductase [Yinghuangia sp. ASG 101]